MVSKQRKPDRSKITVDKGHKQSDSKPFESIALLLQGGGALGAYQAGVYQALSEAGLEPDWVAGISIGAINAAIIAGNAPEQRVAKLREFWELITKDAFQYYPPSIKAMMPYSNAHHQALNFMSSIGSIVNGIPGFFMPHSLLSQGTSTATSFYDTASLKTTLERLVDFDRINNDNMRLSIAAVNVMSGNFTDFDNKENVITAEHVMASGALPPGFPPVEINGDYYWDGGLISNTPLRWIVENKSPSDTLVFQVDLWSAEGEFPQNITEVLTREKAIQFSSRTRSSTDRFREKHALCHAIAALLDKLPADLRKLPEAQLLDTHSNDKVYNIVHLIYHTEAYEGYSKDFEFSRLSMEEHWQSGYNDTINTLKHPEVLQRPRSCEGIAVFDFSRNKESKDAVTHSLAYQR